MTHPKRQLKHHYPSTDSPNISPTHTAQTSPLTQKDSSNITTHPQTAQTSHPPTQFKHLHSPTKTAQTSLPIHRQLKHLTHPHSSNISTHPLRQLKNHHKYIMNLYNCMSLISNSCFNLMKFQFYMFNCMSQWQTGYQFNILANDTTDLPHEPS